MKDIGGLLKKAQKMQADMARMQEELAQKQVEFSAGGGMVTARMNGRQELLAVTIDKQVVDPNDMEMLEDLVVAAVNGARQKVDEIARAEMSKLTAGLPPGLF